MKSWALKLLNPLLSLKPLSRYHLVVLGMKRKRKVSLKYTEEKNSHERNTKFWLIKSQFKIWVLLDQQQRNKYRIFTENLCCDALKFIKLLPTNCPTTQNSEFIEWLLCRCCYRLGLKLFRIKYNSGLLKVRIRGIYTDRYKT